MNQHLLMGEEVMAHRFDPRVQPCLLGLTIEGAGVEPNLLQVLRDADQLRMLTGASPGEVVACLEYLLGICYAADHYPEDIREWRSWVTGHRSLGPAADWLESQSPDDWNLFHPEHPLGQNVLLAPYLDEHGAGPAQLLHHWAGDYVQHLDHHHLHHEAPLTAAAAFRAMLAQHAYGITGRGRVPGKDGLGPALTNLATGRLASRVRVLALGDTLGDTLRLNLHPHDGAPGTFNLSWTGRRRRGFTEKPAGRQVDGPADAHTVLGRSVLLRPTALPEGGVGVDRVLVGAGELLAPLGPVHLQDAVMERTSNGPAPLRPSKHRGLWQEAHALYAAVADRELGTDLYSRLAQLPDQPLTLWAVGVATESFSKVVTWVADGFPFVPGRRAELRNAAEHGSRIAEWTADALRTAAFAAWRLTYPNAKPSDADKQRARFDAREQHFAGCGEPFHLLLDACAEGQEPAAALREYARTIYSTARDLLDQRLTSLPQNTRGFRARAAARDALERKCTDPKAPHYLAEAASS